MGASGKKKKTLLVTSAKLVPSLRNTQVLCFYLKHFYRNRWYVNSGNHFHSYPTGVKWLSFQNIVITLLVQVRNEHKHVVHFEIILNIISKVFSFHFVSSRWKPFLGNVLHSLIHLIRPRLLFNSCTVPAPEMTLGHNNIPIIHYCKTGGFAWKQIVHTCSSILLLITKTGYFVLKKNISSPVQIGVQFRAYLCLSRCLINANRCFRFGQKLHISPFFFPDGLVGLFPSCSKVLSRLQ